MVKETIGQLIRRKRRELGTSQEVLSEKADLSANYIAQLEIGRRNPSLKTLTKLAIALGIPVEEAIGIGIESLPFWMDAKSNKNFEDFDPRIKNLLVEIGKLLEKYI